MGLDMYATAKHYIGAEYRHNEIAGTLVITRKGNPINIDLNKVDHIQTSEMYWRKANHIHKWFVDNVQEGIDDCGEYSVTYQQLRELLKLCEKALNTEDPTVLPTVSGFFFGSTDADEYYWEAIRETKDWLIGLDLEDLGKKDFFERPDFYYRASW